MLHASSLGLLMDEWTPTTSLTQAIFVILAHRGHHWRNRVVSRWLQNYRSSGCQRLRCERKTLSAAVPLPFPGTESLFLPCLE